MRCNSISTVLGSCRRLGPSSDRLEESLAPRQSHSEEKVHLFRFYGTKVSHYLKFNYLSGLLNGYNPFELLWVHQTKESYSACVMWVCDDQGVNVVLRLAWISSIQHVNNFPGFSQVGWDTMFASLEVIRRGHWNFYRCLYFPTHQRETGFRR